MRPYRNRAAYRHEQDVRDSQIAITVFWFGVIAVAVSYLLSHYEEILMFIVSMER
jgi:hypothetical protein